MGSALTVKSFQKIFTTGESCDLPLSIHPSFILLTRLDRKLSMQ